MSDDDLILRLAKTAGQKDSERFKKYQKELLEIARRLQEISEDVAFSTETVSKLPKEYRSKSSV